MHLQQAGNFFDSYVGDTYLLLASSCDISLVKSSMSLMAHFNSCTNSIIQYTTSELQQSCSGLLGEADQSFDVENVAVKNSQIVTDFVFNQQFTFSVLNLGAVCQKAD